MRGQGNVRSREQARATCHGRRQLHTKRRRGAGNTDTMARRVQKNGEPLGEGTTKTQRAPPPTRTGGEGSAPSGGGPHTRSRACAGWHTQRGGGVISLGGACPAEEGRGKGPQPQGSRKEEGGRQGPTTKVEAAAVGRAVSLREDAVGVARKRDTTTFLECSRARRDPPSRSHETRHRNHTPRKRPQQRTLSPCGRCAPGQDAYTKPTGVRWRPL